MKKIFLMLLTGLLLVSCNSNEPTNSDDSTVLDENFDICSVMEDLDFKEYCLKNFDTDGNGKLSLTEGKSVTRIDVSGTVENNMKTGTIK